MTTKTEGEDQPEITDFIGQKKGFDVVSARAAGYTPLEILKFLAKAGLIRAEDETEAPDARDTVADAALDSRGTRGGGDDAGGGASDGRFLAAGAAGDSDASGEPAGGGRKNGAVGGDSDEPTPVAKLEKNGTLTVRGDLSALRQLLGDNGVTSILTMKNALIVGVSQAAQAQEILADFQGKKEQPRAKKIEEPKEPEAAKATEPTTGKRDTKYRVGQRHVVKAGPHRGATVEWDGTGWSLA